MGFTEEEGREIVESLARENKFFADIEFPGWDERDDES